MSDLISIMKNFKPMVEKQYDKPIITIDDLDSLDIETHYCFNSKTNEFDKINKNHQKYDFLIFKLDDDLFSILRKPLFSNKLAEDEVVFETLFKQLTNKGLLIFLSDDNYFDKNGNFKL